MSNKHWLDKIEELDNEMEIATKKGNIEDLSWLAAGSNESMNFLDGIEKLDYGEASPLIKKFVSQGILNIVKKQLENAQLYQPEMKVLKDFRSSFPDITLNELEEAANAI